MIELIIKRNVQIEKEDNHTLPVSKRKKDEAWLKVYNGKELVLDLHCDQVTASPTHMNKDRHGNPFEPAIPLIGRYKNAMIPGLHKGRLALINQGVTPIAFSRGWKGPITLNKFKGLNFHDDKEVSLGCFLAPKDFVDLVHNQTLAHSQFAKGLHPNNDMPFVDLLLIDSFSKLVLS